MKKLILILLAVSLCAVPALAYETRQEMRDAFNSFGMYQGDTPYAQMPVVAPPYAPGKLNEVALGDALSYLNFLRSLADLEPVSRSEIYDFQCQHGAVLLAAHDYVDHYAPQPADMSDDFYGLAYLATSSSNIARFNWMRPTIIREGIAYFVRDDGDTNLPVLGHRRWLLNPMMNATGFGLANSDTGMSYVSMYAHDMGNADAEWTRVCWPTAGVFPVELMHTNLAWSVSLNPEIYNVQRSKIVVTLEEENLGLTFGFNCSAGEGDGFCTVNSDAYGAGPCIIFRPDFAGTDFTDYQQNQRWKVKVTGLELTAGGAAEMEYEVEMASLYVQEVANIELSQIEAELKPGETLALTAAVIPAYADDMSVSWSSSDPSVAAVDGNGVIAALNPGTCEIRAESANGRYDRCTLTVVK